MPKEGARKEYSCPSFSSSRGKEKKAGSDIPGNWTKIVSVVALWERDANTSPSMSNLKG